MHGRIVERFPTAWGIDIDAPNIRTLTDQGYPNLHVASAEDFTLPQRFDTVVAGELVEHLGNPQNFFSQAAKHLKPGGKIVISTPYPFSLLYSLYALTKFPQTCFNPEHTLWMCPRTLSELARRAGLRVLSLRLVEDYTTEKGSQAYKALRAFIRFTHWALPNRLTGNHMLAVLVPH